MNDYITLKDISYTYKKTGFAVRNVSLSLRLGETTVLVGSNGSGKTTLMKLLMGILTPDSGCVCIAGEDTKKKRLSDTAKKIGYLFQNPERQLFCASAKEEIMFSLKHRGVDEAAASKEAARLLAHFSMADRADDYPLKLSRGEKQRLALMAVLAMQPKYYILDEPSSGIDRENKDRLIAMLSELKANGAGMCIISHDRSLIDRVADRVITMKDGAIV
jgi:energy-coupling factor transport system ATP-binding protein